MSPHQVQALQVLALGPCQAWHLVASQAWHLVASQAWHLVASQDKHQLLDPLDPDISVDVPVDADGHPLHRLAAVVSGLQKVAVLPHRVGSCQEVVGLAEVAALPSAIRAKHRISLSTRLGDGSKSQRPRKTTDVGHFFTSNYSKQV